MDNTNYTIHSNGDIVSVARGKPKTFSRRANGQGYSIVMLTLNGKRCQFTVHRLVALKFIPNPDNKPYVNHIDGNKMNNDVSNLEWCTAKENLEHARIHGLNTRVKLSPEQADEIRVKIKTMSQTAIAKQYGVDQSAISRVINNKTHK